MKFKLTIIFVLAVVVLILFTYKQVAQPFARGDKAPEFSLGDLNNRTFHLSDFNGKPALLHFWATWCTQCVHEMPLLEKFARSTSDMTVVAISEDEGGLDAVRSFFRNVEQSYPVLLDTEGRVADRYKSYKIPETYLIDPEGKFLYRFQGAVSWDDPNVLNFIKKTVSGK